VFSTNDDEFIVEPLWNGTGTTVVSDGDAAAAAAAGLSHVIYRRSAVRAASAHSVDHCGLRGLYSVRRHLALFSNSKLRLFLTNYKQYVS